MSDDLALFLPLIFLFWEVCLSQIIINKSIILFYFYFSSIFIVFLLFFYLFFESPLFDAILLHKKTWFYIFFDYYICAWYCKYSIIYNMKRERPKAPLFLFFIFPCEMYLWQTFNVFKIFFCKWLIDPCKILWCKILLHVLCLKILCCCQSFVLTFKDNNICIVQHPAQDPFIEFVYQLLFV